MSTLPSLDALPIWGLFLLISALVYGFVELGNWLGHRRKLRAHAESEASVNSFVGATLGLLAFMMAFSFGHAATRYDLRRQIIVKESNAVGTAYLRADFVPEPQKSQVRQLLREYIDIRLSIVQSNQLAKVLDESERIHLALWKCVNEAQRPEAPTVTFGLFVTALNELIDLHSERVAIGLQNRIPAAIWICLSAITVISMLVIGYHEGISSKRRTLAAPALVLSFSIVMTLVAELDRPKQSIVRISQQSLIDLRDTIDSTAEHESHE